MGRKTKTKSKKSSDQLVRAALIHRSTVASLRVTRTRVRHDMAGGAPARITPQ